MGHFEDLVIRPFRTEDIPTMIGLLRQPGGHYHDSDELDLSGFQETYMCENATQDSLMGFVCIEIHERICQIICYVAPTLRRNGIGSRLFEYAKERLSELDPNTIWVFFRSDIGNSAQFYQNRGAQPWYGYHYMIWKNSDINQPYVNKRIDALGLEVRAYSEDKFGEYINGRADAFYKVNKIIDARPYDERERSEDIKKWVERHKDELFLFYYEGKLAGSITLMEGFFDEVFVVPEYQGKGFGKAIVGWTLERCETKAWNPKLCVVTNNLPAYELYRACGFYVAQTLEMNRFFSANKEPDYRGPIGG